MPFALALGVYAAVSKNNARELRIDSVDFNQYGVFPMRSLGPDSQARWANSIKGMIAMLQKQGHALSGLNITMAGDLPIGAGLSSSAAAEVCTGVSAAALFGLSLRGMELALLAQQAEHAFTGTQCGIMDMAVSVLGKKGHLLKLSCRDLTFTHVPFAVGTLKLFLLNSGVKHNLADGEYNKRRSECAEALAIARSVHPGLTDLSAFSLTELEAHRALFPDKPLRRARHVLSENRRVEAVASSLASRDFVQVGRLMNESHQSLRADYEVTCVETDYLADEAIRIPGCLGARMTGGGFGGSVIALSTPESQAAFESLLERYRAAFQVEPSMMTAVASEGARIL
jgi:galactokinase